MSAEPIRGRQWTEEELDAKFGSPAEVLVLPTGTSTARDNPRPLSLVPCVTGDGETEVAHLLAMHDRTPFELPAVALPALPANSTDAMRKVAEFFAKVRGLRLWAGDDRPVVFSHRFIATHTGLHFRTAGRALCRLKAAGVLEFAGEMPPRGARGTHTYLPGGAS